MQRLIPIICAAVMIVILAVNAEAFLIDRGGGMIYDSDQNITWLQDTNLDGLMVWSEAMVWADQLEYGGYENWRLPSSPATAQGFINEGELGYLYYTELGNPSGGPLSNTGPFTNLRPYPIFWLDAEPLGPTSAWEFDFFIGFQNAGWNLDSNPTWAVRDGDVAPVPIPSAMLLLGSGLIGLIGFRRKLGIRS